MRFQGLESSHLLPSLFHNRIFTKAMDFDIRIVLQWDTDLTDVELIGIRNFPEFSPFFTKFFLKFYDIFVKICVLSKKLLDFFS